MLPITEDFSSNGHHTVPENPLSFPITRTLSRDFMYTDIVVLLQLKKL